MINKRGQVTIFIIVAIVIIALIVLIVMFYPKIKSTLGFETKNPNERLQDCLESEVEEAVLKLSLQGGSIDPESYILYQDNKIEYLCYTDEYYTTCTMQRPLLQNHIEAEIKNAITNRADQCFDEIKEDYEGSGYTVNLKKGDMTVELLPKRVSVSFEHELTLTKQHAENYESFKVVLDNNLYELVSITNSILNWEARYGDAETTTYMNYYHDLKVEKLEQSDGTTIYILTDRNTKNKFQFASRSLIWPI